MAKKVEKSSSGKRKRWSFEFGPAGMVGLCSVVALIMAWAFILGILVGRGYKPESVISELSQMVPHLTREEPGPSASKPLLPEELRFYETLQERAAPVIPAAPPREMDELTVPAPPLEVQPAPPPRQPEDAPESTETAPAGEVFDYVYQVAAFQILAQAQAMQQRILASGIDASVETRAVNGEVWHRVLVSLRGTTQDAVRTREKLREFGIERPFIRSKNPL